MKIAFFYNPQSFDAPPQGTLASREYPNVYLIFLETRIIDLHFPADSYDMQSYEQAGVSIGYTSQ